VAIHGIFPCWFAVQWKDIAAGAQTERWGGARPVRSLLGGKTSPATFDHYLTQRRAAG
jgi:hypothetical protein